MFRQTTLGQSIAAARPSLLAALCAAPTAQSVETKWPGTKAGEPAPKVEGIPAELARNLAVFDDLHFRVYCRQQWQDPR